MRYLAKEGELSLTYSLGGCSYLYAAYQENDKNLNIKPKAEEILFTFSVFSCLKDLGELCAM